MPAPFICMKPAGDQTRALLPGSVRGWKCTENEWILSLTAVPKQLCSTLLFGISSLPCYNLPCLSASEERLFERRSLRREQAERDVMKYNAI